MVRGREAYVTDDEQHRQLPGAPAIHVAETPGLVTVRLVGEFDIANVADVKAVLEETARHNHVHLDLTQCEFIDSSVLGALLRANNEARLRDRWLSGTVPPEGSVVYRVLQIAGAFDLMDLTIEGAAE
jgi:anti-anti-sigma factor